MSRIIGLGNIQGQLANWVCQQSPYRSVKGVDTANGMLRDALNGDWTVLSDGYATRNFTSWREIERWIKSVFDGSGVTKAWNTPKSGHNENVFTSRYHSVKPEHDFIDIDALFRNVSRAVWADCADYEVEAGDTDDG